METVLKTLCVPLTYFPSSPPGGWTAQNDAQGQSISLGKVVSTDPPYYDNIAYADLSDFFYVWLRRSLRQFFPDVFATVAVPKAEELVATPYRHGSKEKAEAFFLEGMTSAMHRIAEQSHPAFPVTIYYAFKQSETESETGTSSTGWETFLDAVIRAGFSTSGTWPMRTELANRMIGKDTNALASSIVLVCRPRAADAPTATRREFVAMLKKELPVALRHLQAGNIAPVDLAQSSIGPGMGIFTRYAKVLDAQGKPMSVREALALINEVLDEALAEQEGDFDSGQPLGARVVQAIWFCRRRVRRGETLTKAKNTSVEGLFEAGILESKRGKIACSADELQEDWSQKRTNRLKIGKPSITSSVCSPAAVKAPRRNSSPSSARKPKPRVNWLTGSTRFAANGRNANEALAYNGLVQSWPELMRLAQISAQIGHSARPSRFDIILLLLNHSTHMQACFVSLP